MSTSLRGETGGSADAGAVGVGAVEGVPGAEGARSEYLHFRKASVRDWRMAFQFACWHSSR